MLADGLHDVPLGKIATVVTHLEMRARADISGRAAPEGWTLRRVENPSLGWYRRIFQAVGEDWLWFSRRGLSDDALAAIIHNDDVAIWTLSNGDTDAALLELDFRQRGECELAFFGVTPTLIGTGAGRYLMDVAIDQAWSRDITRFHVHTCTLDSPQALGFYRRAGFTPIRQQIEIDDDPRVAKGFDHELAPHVPLLLP
ncbi:GNAT family N-acetyltransferase [Pseudosulfitobacter koreensis]|uniref:GNAT family N-acetyltransferase n=1 Tax=Pseudosulfitobacter koreensis TaxID=2968472 RepID=A0ABT1YW67_9RHOB|nr:GNAT family N-acetyltransferase [Pseudosulfitobacter koreense]MCR8825109.1 GNAT family N-acetyltransferase [Pseudosulfitobacter koreense]